MPPQQREMDDHNNNNINMGGMRRVTSESDMSDAGQNGTSSEYRVRKSRLIG